jgi:hypothetical protein
MKTQTANITAPMESITPAAASRMLAFNTSNRPLSKQHVANLAREMKCGRWKVNGDTIVLNGTRLIDGQHRLKAVEESGVTIDALVVYGVSSSAFDTIDVGRRRSGGDTFSTMGEMNANALAATLKIVDAYMSRRFSQNHKLTNAELQQLLERYPDIRNFVNKHKTRVFKLAPGSVLCACHYLFAMVDEDQADQFISDLVSGQNLQAGDPVYVLRVRLMDRVLSKIKSEPDYTMALIIKAWNARRAGKPLRFLHYRSGGKHEDFPTIE